MLYYIAGLALAYTAGCIWPIQKLFTKAKAEAKKDLTNIANKI